jgi:hypothetical protein
VSPILQFLSVFDKDDYYAVGLVAPRIALPFPDWLAFLQLSAAFKFSPAGR